MKLQFDGRADGRRDCTTDLADREQFSCLCFLFRQLDRLIVSFAFSEIFSITD